MSAGRPAAFLFGKLPAHGDFVARGLSEPGREAWDLWASAALEALRGVAADFETAHEQVPPWRFIAGPQAAGEGWRIGALAPSVDSAGRRFVIVAGLSGWSPAQAAGQGMAFAAHAEAVLYRAIAEQLTADAAVEMLAQTAEPFIEEAAAAEALGADPAAAGVWWSDGAAELVRVSAAPPTDLLAACAPGFTDPAA